jgi:hypothetical protein
MRIRSPSPKASSGDPGKAGEVIGEDDMMFEQPLSEIRKRSAEREKLQAENERLKAELHEWEESDAAKEVMGPLIADLSKENERLRKALAISPKTFEEEKL